MNSRQSFYSIPFSVNVKKKNYVLASISNSLYVYANELNSYRRAPTLFSFPAPMSPPGRKQPICWLKLQVMVRILAMKCLV